MENEAPTIHYCGDCDEFTTHSKCHGAIIKGLFVCNECEATNWIVYTHDLN